MERILKRCEGSWSKGKSFKGELGSEFGSLEKEGDETIRTSRKEPVRHSGREGGESGFRQGAGRSME